MVRERQAQDGYRVCKAYEVQMNPGAELALPIVMGIGRARERNDAMDAKETRRHDVRTFSRIARGNALHSVSP